MKKDGTRPHPRQLRQVFLQQSLFKMDVPVADVTMPLDEQMDVVREVMAAIRVLLPLVDAVLGSRE